MHFAVVHRLSISIPLCFHLPHSHHCLQWLYHLLEKLIFLIPLLAFSTGFLSLYPFSLPFGFFSCHFHLPPNTFNLLILFLDNCIILFISFHESFELIVSLSQSLLILRIFIFSLLYFTIKFFYLFIKLTDELVVLLLWYADISFCVYLTGFCYFHLLPVFLNFFLCIL